MKVYFHLLILFAVIFLWNTPSSLAGSCPGWLLKDLKRAHKISGITSQRYKISGKFGKEPLSVIGEARKKGPRCVVNILGYTLPLRRSGSCVKFAFSFSGANHHATWCRNKGRVLSNGTAQSATVKRLPVARREDIF